MAKNESRNDGRATSVFHVEQPTRSILDWSPARVNAAIVEADSGQMALAADLCERLMSDARIKGILSTRTHGLFGLPLQFQGAARQVKQLQGTDEAPGDWFTMFPESELARYAAWGIVFGIGLAQRVRDENREVGAPDAPMIRTWSPRWLRYQWASMADPKDHWFLNTIAGEIEIHPGDGEWMLYTPYGLTRPWADGAWRGLSEAWLLKQCAKNDRARFSEVHGSPTRVGMAPQGASERSRQRWLAQIKRMGRDTSFVLPAGYDMKMVEAQGRGFEVYASTIDLSDQDIAIELTGQLVTTMGTKGFSNGNIHQDIKRDLVKFTAESLSTNLHKQGLQPWAASNFGDPAKAPFNSWDIDPPADQKTKAEALGALGDAVAKINAAVSRYGKQLDVEEFVEEWGLEFQDALKPEPGAFGAPGNPPGNDPNAPGNDPNAPGNDPNAPENDPNLPENQGNLPPQDGPKEPVKAGSAAPDKSSKPKAIQTPTGARGFNAGPRWIEGSAP